MKGKAPPGWKPLYRVLVCCYCGQVRQVNVRLFDGTITELNPRDYRPVEPDDPPLGSVAPNVATPRAQGAPDARNANLEGGGEPEQTGYA